ncbi:RNA polymerase sigma factor region1.1 domain-containing protein [Paramagnetospirillum caucaseum]|uniref:RNA polymerase sigma factor region1.1 domain-containing protein n=1 Tax=Paramagnetospirillum caucaseum TaxID=1244869 RepID=UPI00034AD028
MATKSTNTAEVSENQDEAMDGPLLDTLGVAVKKMVAKGKERGYVTYDELNAAMPPEEVSSEQIEDTMAMLSELGINVVESEEGEDNAPRPPRKRPPRPKAIPAPATWTRRTWAVPTTRSACTCARWARWSC